VNALENVNVLKEEVLGIRYCIQLDRCPGPDGFVPMLLRDARGEKAGALTDIFTSSLTTGEDPEDWRTTNVLPLFWKGSRGNP